jgi:hypothetical protein
VTHIMATILIALVVSMCGFFSAPRAIKYRYVGLKNQSPFTSALGQLYAMAFGFSLCVPVFYALSEEPKYQVLFLGVCTWVVISIVYATKTYNRFRRIIGYLHEKAP